MGLFNNAIVYQSCLFNGVGSIALSCNCQVHAQICLCLFEQKEVPLIKTFVHAWITVVDELAAQFAVVETFQCQRYVHQGSLYSESLSVDFPRGSHPHYAAHRLRVDLPKV